MRNKILLSLSLLCLGLSVHAQNLNDALNYARKDILGTARYTAMSGAFGALGGDLSALSDNPAAGAVFLADRIDVSLLIGDYRADAIYGNHSNIKNHTNWNISNAGLVRVIPNYSGHSNWSKTTWGINYKLNSAYGGREFISGIGQYSLADYFTDLAQGYKLDLFTHRQNETVSSLYQLLGEQYGSRAQTAYLGYEAYLFDPVNPDSQDNTDYVANVAGNSFEHYKTYKTSGYNSVTNFNLSGLYNENLYLGINLNAHILDYSENKVIEELPESNSSNIDYIWFEESLKTTGTGFSAQIGAIYSFDSGLRLGASYTSPQWLKLEEETMQYIETDIYDQGELLTVIVDPRVINIYERYTLRLPAKLDLSAAYVIGSQGLISMQYGYTDQSKMAFKPRSSHYFSEQNDIIKEELQATSSFRIGGEYNIDFVSLRAGYHYEESPYKSSKALGDTQGYSFGIGFNFYNFKFDIAYLYSEQESNKHMIANSASDLYKIDNKQNNFIASLSFGF